MLTPVEQPLDKLEDLTKAEMWVHGRFSSYMAPLAPLVNVVDTLWVPYYPEIHCSILRLLAFLPMLFFILVYFPAPRADSSARICAAGTNIFRESISSLASWSMKVRQASRYTLDCYRYVSPTSGMLWSTLARSFEP